MRLNQQSSIGYESSDLSTNAVRGNPPVANHLSRNPGTVLEPIAEPANDANINTLELKGNPAAASSSSSSLPQKRKKVKLKLTGVDLNKYDERGLLKD